MDTPETPPPPGPTAAPGPPVPTADKFVAAVILVVLVAAISVGAWFVNSMFDTEPPIAFDSAVWKSTPATYEDTSVRLRMADDLLRSHPLEGRTRDEVIALLGPPDGDSPATPTNPTSSVSYFLGPAFGVDAGHLVITFDEAGTVTKAFRAAY